MPDRPNDVLRAALVRALDAADAAGVVLSAAFGTRYRPPVPDSASVLLQGRDADGEYLLPGTARRILAELGVDDPETGAPYKSASSGVWLASIREPGGVRVIATAPPEHVEDLVVEAVLAS